MSATNSMSALWVHLFVSQGITLQQTINCTRCCLPVSVAKLDARPTGNQEVVIRLPPGRQHSFVTSPHAFHSLSFEKICEFDSYFRYMYIISNFRSSSIKGKVYLLL